MNFSGIDGSINASTVSETFHGASPLYSNSGKTAGRTDGAFDLWIINS
jgi:hypothetical protein